MELPPSQECTVCGILAFVLRLSKIFGVAALKFEKFGNGWQIRVSKATSFYGITFIIIACVVTFTARFLQFRPSAIGTRNYTVAFSYGLAVALLVVMFSEIYFKQYRMKHIITCLAEVQKVNDELSEYAVYKSNESFQRFMATSTLLGALIILVMDSSLLLHTNSNRSISGLAHGTHLFLHLIFTMVKILNLQISLIFTTVLCSYKHLNECLRNLLQQIWKESSEPKILKPLSKSRSNAYTNISPKSINILIDSLGTIEDQAPMKYENIKDVILSRVGFLYCILHDIVQQLDDTHGLFVVSLLIHHFIYLAVTLYNFFNYLIRSKDYFQMAVWFLWAISYISDVVIIIEPSHQTCQQVKRTKYLISQLMLITPAESLSFNSELNLFYKNLLFNEVSYSPMKMFKLNRTIITVFVGSIITYLAVILQI